MAYCSNCGAETENAKLCDTCGRHLPQHLTSKDFEEKGRNWYFILGLLFPLVGFIMFFVLQKRKPESSKRAIVGTIIGIPLALFVYGLIVIPLIGNAIPPQIDRDRVLTDALAIENSAKLFCSQNYCSYNQELTWNELQDYAEGIDESYYDFYLDNAIAIKSFNGDWKIYMEASGTGNYEFDQGGTPSKSDRSDVNIDTN